VPTYLDRDIGGDGSDVFTGNQVLYAVVRLTSLGGDVRDGDVGSGQILRAGWITFGDELAVIGSTAEYWRELIYLNFTTTLYTPNPSTDAASGALRLIASRVKWHLSFGTNGHIYVFGA